MRYGAHRDLLVLAVGAALTYTLQWLFRGTGIASNGHYDSYAWRKPGSTLSATLLAETEWSRVELHTVKKPDGSVVNDWLWMDERDHVNVITRLEGSGKFMFFNQTKYGLDGWSLAPPAGYMDRGESPEEAARRELGEELGMSAQRLVQLGGGVGYRTAVNRGLGFGYNVLALDAKPTAEASRLRMQSDDWELQGTDRVQLSCREMREAWSKGHMRESHWALSTAQALMSACGDMMSA